MTILMADAPSSTPFKEHCEAIREKIRQYDHNHRGVISEESHRWLLYWDKIRALSVLFVAVVSPIELTMRRSFEVNAIIITGLAISALFLVDMVLTFNRAYRPKRGSKYVYNRRMIARRYFRGWFFIDIISTIPYDLAIILLGDARDQLEMTIRFFSVLKVSRGLKLVPVLNSLINYMTHRLRITYSAAEVFRLSIAMLFMVHYLACLWTYVGLRFEDTFKTEVGSTVGEMSWIQAQNLSIYAEIGYTHRLYAVATFVSITAVFGGVSSVSPNNYCEYIVLSVMMLLGGLVWAWVLSSLCSIFSSLNPHEAAYKNQMDELTFFMEEQHLPKPFRKRLRDFFHQTQDFARAEGFDELFLRMSDQLRSETAQLVARDSLSKIWYFNVSNPRWTVEPEFLGAVALYLRPSVYEIHERISMDKLTVITRGQVWQGVRIYASGGVLGMDSIIDDRFVTLRQLAPASCLSFVQANAISRSQLFSLADGWPGAKAALNRAGKYLVVRAAMLVMYRRHVKGNEAMPKERMASVVLDQLKATSGVATATGPGQVASAPLPLT